MSTELAALEEISKLLGDQQPPKAEKDKPAPPIRPLFTVSDLQALKEGEVIINRFRSMPFKTKLMYDWKTDWGKPYPTMEYHERAHREVKVFDLKGFVHKLKGTTDNGMPNMMDNPMGMVNPFMPQGMMPGGRGGISPTSLDDYVKKLDEKIAELEKEEEMERQAQERANKAQVTNVTVNNIDGHQSRLHREHHSDQEKDEQSRAVLHVQAGQRKGCQRSYKNAQRNLEEGDDQVILHVYEQTALGHGICEVVPGNFSRKLEQGKPAHKVFLML